MQLFRQASELAFAQARVKLSMTSIPSLNNWQAERAIPVVGYLLHWRRGIVFYMRVEQFGENSFACVRQFLRSGATDRRLSPLFPGSHACRVVLAERSLIHPRIQVRSAKPSLKFQMLQEH